MATLVLLNKPFNTLSQFTDSSGRATLRDYISAPNLYPAGRLDYDSEGLLLLTDSGPLQAQLSDPRFGKHKVYWAQVEGAANAAQCRQLCSGVPLKDGIARAVACELLAEPPLWPRTPPIRERRNIPTSWLTITLNEGRNRQVRRMTAAVGLPTLRLVRVAIGDWTLGELQPGESLSLNVAAPPPRHRRQTSSRRAPRASVNKT
ncbi:pseudouridine synthase [Gammaproteobacteria bacterium LSUCC0057]|uniref:Pseudouridine synthase n=1 Tax=Gammaproteobacteria bacterium LSUCC0057 TaxID=2559237 RepID=A0A4Y8UJM3_9GAMM|nr:pseudouridine synthase [Gammaproteobacteria bacterium LSUCC0057]